MNAQTKNIVFDWNSTLLDDIDAMLECQNILMARIGRPPITMEFFRTHYEVPFDNLYRNFGLSESEIESAMGFDRHIFHEHYEPMADRADLRSGALEILQTAQKHGVQNFILSNHIVGPIRNQLRRLDIEHHFADVIAYADRASQFQHMTKGQKLQHFMREKNAAPHDAMIVGDTVEEIHIGREQGLISVAITGGCVSEERLRAENPDHVIHSLHELKPILQERGFVS